ncbi:MAG: hypothetical protein WC641_06960 [Patescibacteria group bacterium]
MKKAKGKRRRNRTGPVPVDVAMRDLGAIAPDLADPRSLTDPQEIMEEAAEIEEGRDRHGFRAIMHRFI